MIVECSNCKRGIGPGDPRVIVKVSARVHPDDGQMSKDKMRASACSRLCAASILETFADKIGGDPK